MRPWISYTLLRVGLFGLIFVILLLVGLEPWVAALIAAAIGFCVSYIFFRPLRQEVADELSEARTSRKSESAAASDEDVEDADPR
jgi:uncharacterized membrane protein YphA (DoxX/SURF4 family)